MKKGQQNDWCPMSDSNRPPTDYKSVALPDELMGHKPSKTGF